MSVLNSKSHNLQARKYDVTGSKEYVTSPVDYLFPPNMTGKFYENLNIFHRDKKKMWVGVFSDTVLYKDGKMKKKLKLYKVYVEEGYWNRLTRHGGGVSELMSRV